MSELEEMENEELEFVASEVPLTVVATMKDIQAEIREMFIAFHGGEVFDFKRLEEIAKYGKKNL